MLDLLQNESISLRISDKRSVRPHNHNFLELAYVAEGCAEHIIGGRRMLISKGNYFIVDYNTVHSYRSIDDKPLVIINCLFKPRLLDNSLLYCRSFAALLQHYLIKVDARHLRIDPSNTLFEDADGKILGYLRALQSEYTEKSTGFLEMMRSVFVEMMIATVRKIAPVGEQRGLIAELTDYVARHYAEPLSLSAFATAKGYSLPYLSARFKREVGMGFREYLVRVRIEQACRLLANTDKKVLEIASDVGYSDANFFYNAFRRITGQAPRDFRRAVREQA